MRLRGATGETRVARSNDMAVAVSGNTCRNDRAVNVDVFAQQMSEIGADCQDGRVVRVEASDHS